jgi:HAD superfamily hydrolase (TIGR01509 family)
MSLQALIFDVDGTLADTEETHRQAFNAAFVQFELPWDWRPQQYAELLTVSGGKERIVAYVDMLDLGESERARLRQLAPAIHREKTRLFTELIADGRARLRAGVARLLREAKEARVRLAIASTTTAANVEALIASNLGRDALGDFAAIACGDQVQAKKPAPDIYTLVLGTLGLPAAACVAFEDSGNGVRAAKGAGLFTVVTPTIWTATQDFRGADLVLHSLGDPRTPVDAAAQERIGAKYLTLEAIARLHAAGPAEPYTSPLFRDRSLFART